MLTLYHNDMSTCSQKARLCLAEKGLAWEDRHIDIRSGQHQKEWYVKLNRRAVVPTLVDGDKAVPESNVILEYLDDAYPEPPLRPQDAYGRALVRLWTKQLDEDIHDAGIAILSFAVAFRHQYIARGEAGRVLLEKVPTASKRERRRDVIERGLESSFFIAAITRLEKLFSDMDEALQQHSWLVGNEYSLADVAFTPYLVRIENLEMLQWLDSKPRLADWFERVRARPSYADAVTRWENESYLSLMRPRGREDWPVIRTALASL